LVGRLGTGVVRRDARLHSSAGPKGASNMQPPPSEHNPPREHTLVRKRVVYHGRVQGVSFRATTEELARGRAVVGFVRNLSDGTVELESQGHPDQVERFLAAVSSRYRHYIARAEVSLQAVRDDEFAFRVTY
jgi:acylphosphatase